VRECAGVAAGNHRHCVDTMSTQWRIREWIAAGWPRAEARCFGGEFQLVVNLFLTGQARRSNIH